MDNYRLLDWDSNFFGFPVAIVFKENISESELVLTLKELKSRKVSLVYFPSKNRFNLNNSLLTQFNGQLVDQKITYNKKFIPVNQPEKYIWPFNPEIDDQEIMVQLGYEAGAFSRFNTDSNISKITFRKLYKGWMENALHKKLADEVLVYNMGNQIYGMVTLKMEKEFGSIGLISVIPGNRGQGIGKSLLNSAEAYFSDKTSLLKVVTQKQNINACKFYESYGFDVENEVFYYHFWLNQ